LKSFCDGRLGHLAFEFIRMTTAISHHYNPQVYLRQFTNPKAKNELWQYNLTNGAVEKSTPQNCGCEDYYNSVALKEGGRDDKSLEEVFYPLENALPKIFEAIRNKQAMTDNLWSLFFTFAAIQDARSPATVGVIDEFLGQIHQTSFEMLCKGSPKFQKIFTSLGVDPLKATDCLEMKASKGSALLLSLQAISEVAEILSRMKWNFLYAPVGKYFFTSDHPICRWTPPEKRNIYSGSAYDQDTEITFPLSRRVCACAHWTNSWPETHNEIATDKVNTINSRTVRKARQFVYGAIMDAQIAELVQEKFKKGQSSCQPIETK
jgi:predicted transcriptional regulator